MNIGLLSTFIHFSKINKMQLTIDILMKVNVCRYKDNKPLTPGSRYWINRDGGHCTLTIRDVMESDTGQYTCKIINPAGETSCTGLLELPSNYVAPVHPISYSKIPTCFSSSYYCFSFIMLGTKAKKDSSVDSDYSPFARRFSRDSTKSDHEGKALLCNLDSCKIYISFIIFPGHFNHKTSNNKV